ncbi:MAG TPA: hypothetical protein VLL54_14060 [Pyrinomonadaceae bacterium]|nr:hypothetical protein [Pyrinomonadaceae bacterium]
MVYVETVDLSSRGVALPNDRVGMVIAQPHVSDAALSPQEPYHYTEQAKQQQLAALTETMAVARAVPHGAAKTHFTVFPEYSIPGLDGVALVESAIRANDWPNGTIVIGGTDGLTQAQYVQLLQGDDTHVDAVRNGSDRVGPDEWVNCAITWIKSGDGNVERWIQLKLHPAREEMDVSHQHMFRGTAVYLFKGLLENGAPYRFGTLVCFDWIAAVGAETPCQSILADLHRQAAEHQLPLSWLFVVQRNKKPSHSTFLAGVAAFFNQTQFPNALRERACLVFANTAGRAAPGRTAEFGACSIVLSPQSLFDQPSCVPTFSKGGPRFRDGSNLLNGYKDVVFRERGACIHSFAQINPGSLVPGPAGRIFAVDQAHVYPISGAAQPRAPAGAVPASVKWLNDELDDIPSLAVAYRTAPLVRDVNASHQRIITALRGTAPQSATNVVRLAAQESTNEHADDWDHIEAEALRNLVHTLDIVGVAFTLLAIGVDLAHASLMMDSKTIDVLAIQGASHEECIEHSKHFLPSPQRQTLLVSRDRDNTDWHRRFGSFLQPDTPQPGDEPKITDPASGSMHLGYQNLLRIFRRSETIDALKGGISAELAA